MNKTKFFLRFLAFTIILFAAWIPFAEIFEGIKYAVVDFTFNLISDDRLIFPETSYPSGAMTNILPFIALVLATPKIVLQRKIRVIVIGAAVIFALEVITIDIFYLFENDFGMLVETFMYSVGMVFFPVALWLFMLYRDIFPKEAEQEEKEEGYIKAIKKILPHEVQKEKHTCPVCKKEQENIVVHLKSEHENKMKSKKVKKFLEDHPGLKRLVEK